MTISNCDEGHLRKVKSYETESYFYKHMAAVLLKAGVALPHPFIVEIKPTVTIFPLYFSSSISKFLYFGVYEDGSFGMSLLMSDLRDDFPVLGDLGMNLKQSMAATDWVAKFHGTCWEMRSLNGLQEGLWPEACVCLFHYICRKNHCNTDL